MKHYKSPTNEVWAYELDGSQDHLIPENFIAITDEEANAINEQNRIQNSSQYQEPTKEELMAKMLEIQRQLENLV